MKPQSLPSRFPPLCLGGKLRLVFGLGDGHPACVFHSVVDDAHSAKGNGHCVTGVQFIGRLFLSICTVDETRHVGLCQGLLTSPESGILAAPQIRDHFLLHL
jgi:hypothetical protein